MSYEVLISSNTDKDDTAFTQCAKKQRSSPDPWRAPERTEWLPCARNSSHPACSKSHITRANLDGSCYTGEICVTHNKRQGQGAFINSRKDRYDGEWMHNRRHGYGVYMWLNGDYFEGYWEQGKMHGQGVFRWRNGDEYTGQWVSGRMHGHGTKIMCNGDCYVGEWKNDCANGKGVKTFRGGDRHEGEYVDDKRQGAGVYYWVSGDKYDGNWEAGKMQGYGVKTMANGDIYEGEWFQDKAHNYGEKRFAGGDRHCGFYRADKRHGYGVYTWKHGDRFEGTWVDGELKGVGTYYYGTHSVFKGEWQNGRKHGEGIFTTKNKSYRETWENGVRTSRQCAEKYYPQRLLRTLKEELSSQDSPSSEIRHEIDRLQALLSIMQAGPSLDLDEGIEKASLIAKDASKSEEYEPELPTKPDDQCKICYNASINCVLIRCGHMCTCLDCSSQLEKCPICRKHIDDVIQTFKV